MGVPISALTAASNAEPLLPLAAGVFNFPVDFVVGATNRRVSPYQNAQNSATQFWSGIVNLKVGATTTLAVPAGFVFFLDGVYIVTTTVAGLVAQPVVSFGVTGDNVKYVNALQFTALTATARREFVAVTGTEGETTLNATVDTIADAATFSGRFGWRGTLIAI